MQTYTTHPTDTREGAPRAARLALCPLHQWFTFVDDCGHAAEPEYRYAVIGTHYGHLHNSSGDWRLWRNASSAYAAARDLRDYYRDYYQGESA